MGAYINGILYAKPFIGGKPNKAFTNENDIFITKNVKLYGWYYTCHFSTGDYPRYIYTITPTLNANTTFYTEYGVKFHKDKTKLSCAVYENNKLFITGYETNLVFTSYTFGLTRAPSYDKEITDTQIRLYNWEDSSGKAYTYEYTVYIPYNTVSEVPEGAAIVGIPKNASLSAGVVSQIVSQSALETTTLVDGKVADWMIGGELTRNTSTDLDFDYIYNWEV